MSVQTDPVPPVPEHTPPLKEDEHNAHVGKFFNHAWTRWFVSVREKINVLNESIINLAGVVGNGILVKNGAAWVLRTIIGTASDITVTNGNGASGNPIISSANTGVTAGTYGDATNVAQITVNAVGKITEVVDVPITGGGGGTPVVNVQISDMYTPITTSIIGGWIVPDNIEFQDIWIGLRGDVSTSGDVEVDAQISGVTILSQNPIITVGDTTSLSNPTVISDVFASKGDILTFPVVTAGTDATGLEAVISYVLGTPAGYYSEVLADAPVLWWRHNEASGTVMEAEIGTDGIYSSATGVGAAPIYPEVTYSYLADSNLRGIYSGTIPALNELTIESLVEFNVLSGFRGLLCNDNGSGPRMWQWRMNGNVLEFVRIANFVGPTTTEVVPGTLSTGTLYHLTVTISATGVIIVYVNGSPLLTSAAYGAANFGGGGLIEIGYMSGGGGASANARFSESAIYDYVLSPARIAAHAAAAGV